ncbi:MAG: hypothetical protein KF830_16280 [Planctomycetes bacterium]|nr:hypothetical protein [Planctomycetota bacterium]
MKDWADRWVDAGLQELHGSRPPDLSARVLLALRDAPSGALPALPPLRRTVGVRWALASAALVLLGVTAGALLSTRPARDAEAVVQIELALHEGALACVEVGPDAVRRSQHAAGARVPFAARAGNRLLATAPSRFQVGPYGELATGPATELEVRQMVVRWQQGVVAASSLTIAVVAGVVTWHSLERSGTASAGEVLQLDAAARGEGPVANAAELEQLRQRVRQLEQQNENLQLQLSRTQAEPVPLAAAPDAEPDAAPAPVAAGAVFADERYADLLAKLDWRTMGEVTHEMGPMLVELIERMRETGEIPLDLATKVGALNLKLVQQVPALLESGLPGSGANGAYTHPLVAANVLASTLAAAGLGIDQGQRDRIAGLVRQFSAETQAAVDSVQEFDVQRLALEAETKDRFYREVASLLTPEQQRVMFPAGADRYEGGSLFHSSLFLRQYTEPVPAANAAEFARSVANSVGQQLDLDDQASAQVRAIVERFAAAPELWQDRADAVERGQLQMLRRGRTEAAMRHQAAMLREILRQVPLSEAQRKQLRQAKHVFVPLPK